MINGGVHFTERGIVQNIRAMRMQQVLMSITNENVTGFDKIGYILIRLIRAWQKVQKEAFGRGWAAQWLMIRTCSASSYIGML